MEISLEQIAFNEQSIRGLWVGMKGILEVQLDKRRRRKYQEMIA